MKEKVFQYRGKLFIPAGLILFVLAKPTIQSIIIGLLVSFLLGEGIRIWAVGYSGETTRSDELEAPQLVTAGPYGYVRNPLYLGNFISWIGFCIVACGATKLWETLLIYGSVIISNFVVYGIIIPLEENFLKEQFKEPFEEYIKEVPRLFPRFTPYIKPNGKYKSEVILKAESQTIVMLGLVTLLMVFKFFRIIPWIL